jgi:type IX secretion system substrate protein
VLSKFSFLLQKRKIILKNQKHLMKKTVLTIISIVAANFLFAQSIAPNAIIIKSIAKPKQQNSQMSVMVLDTLDQYYQRATSFYIYGSLDGGYVYGTGLYTGLPLSDETACHYDGIGNATVTELLLYAAAKHIVGTADSITAKVYTVNADTSANATLGTANLSLDDLDTTGMLTSIPITASISSAFLVSVAYAGIDDTFGLVSSDPSMGDGAGEKRARQLLSSSFGSNWIAIDDLYGGQLDCDVMMIPVVDITSGMTEFDTKAFSLKPVYPSPANDHITLDYSLKNNTDAVSYVIFDKAGKAIISKTFADQNTGTHSSDINISALSAGSYYLTFKAGETSVTQKFVKVR